jgi:hypothetical protein
VDRDETFGLVTDVDDDGGLGHFQHSALDDLPSAMLRKLSS